MKNLFSRRNFLKTAAISGTAAALPGSVVAAPLSLKDDSFELNENPLKLGIMTYTIAKEWDIDTIIKNLSETGYQSVELRTTHAHGIEVTLSKEERKEVKKRFEDSPLEAISLASAFKYHSPDPEEVKKILKVPKSIPCWHVMWELSASGSFQMPYPRRCRRKKPWNRLGKPLPKLVNLATTMVWR